MNKQYKYRTDFLTANSFLIGMGSVFNIAGDYFIYNRSKSEAEADFLALLNDWSMVGQDIKNSMDIFQSENESQKQLVIPFAD